MSPPITYDGDEVSAITYDGDEISEVTYDGDVVFRAIPDGEIHYHPGDEGSGTTLTDNVGSVDLTLSADSWLSESAYTGGVGLDLRNNSVNATGDLQQPTARTRFIRLRAQSFNGSSFSGIITHGSDPSLNYLESSSAWVWRDPSGNDVTASHSASTGTIYIVVLRVDSNDVEIDVYDNNQNSVASGSGSNPNTSYDSTTTELGTRNGGDAWDGSIDPNMDTFDRRLSDSEVQTVLDERF